MRFGDSQGMQATAQNHYIFLIFFLHYYYIYLMHVACHMLHVTCHLTATLCHSGFKLKIYQVGPFWHCKTLKVHYFFCLVLEQKQNMCQIHHGEYF